MLERTVPPSVGLAPAKLDMPMVKGTLVTGRVTDARTGRPIKGGLRYATLSGNKHLLDLPGKDVHAQGVMGYHLDADGGFKLIAPPGPGIIVVQAASRRGEEKPYPQVRIRAEDKSKPYLRRDAGLGEVFITSGGIFSPLIGSHAYRLIDPPVGASKLTVDIKLDPGKPVEGKVVGPDGKPLAGATVAGLTAGFEGPKTIKGDTFTAEAILPDDTRTVAAGHAGKKLGGVVVIRGSEKAPPVVKLGAWGAVAGRVVDAEGKPLAGVQVRLYFKDHTAALLHRHLTGGKFATTDDAGKFRADVPFGGLAFDLSFAHKGKFLSTGKPRRGLTVSAGKTVALGDVAVRDE
jgi:hypothetical protein